MIHDFRNTKKGEDGSTWREKPSRSRTRWRRTIRLASACAPRRHELGLTLKEVADSAGLSVGFISQVERGLTAPSLSSLVSISGVLKTEIGSFLEQPRVRASYTRHDQRQTYSIEDRSVAYERVSSSFPGQTMHSVIINMPPGYRSEPIVHEGEEMEFVLEGTVTSELEGKTVVLQVGDSVHSSVEQTPLPVEPHRKAGPCCCGSGPWICSVSMSARRSDGFEARPIHASHQTAP